MARKTVTVMISDLSGLEIPTTEYAKVVVTTGNVRYTTDVSRTEVDELIAKGRKSKRAGRKPQAA